MNRPARVPASDNRTTQEALAVIKSGMKATWEDGDYSAFSRYMEPGARDILDSWDIRPGERMLDVACGSGQTVIPAARKGIRATGLDLAENLIADAKERARREALIVRLDAGDAEDLPYAAAEFDVVISLIGAMFAPRPDVVTREMARVLRPRGRLYMANWTPRSFPAQMFKCVASRVPPPPGVPAPVLWGDEAAVEARLADDFTIVSLARRTFPRWHYSFTPGELVDFFRAFFGPVKRAFEAVGPAGEEALHDELEEIFAANSETHDGILTITGGEYLDVVATRR